jgi:hypothetical protein
MWGMENWGEMLWGGATAVPVMQPVVMLFLVAALLLSARFALRPGPRHWLMWLSLTVLVSIPLVAFAAEISLPHVLRNGLIADADEVMANFDTLVAESNAQDVRLSLLEPGPVLSSCSWEVVSSTGLGPIATGVCTGGAAVVSGGCQLNSGGGKMLSSVPVASHGAPLSSVSAWRCTYDAASQFDILMLCCGP